MINITPAGFGGGPAPEACLIAQNLARNCGYAVFPCLESKAPSCPDGFKRASNDPKTIAALWHRYPGPLVGIATGVVSGIDVLDLDLAKHPTAVAWWEQAKSLMPATRTYRTRSGELHLYFQHAPGVRDTAGKLGLGIDTRGDGGYAISWWCAGLECVDHTPVPAWPQKLLALVMWEPPPRPSKPQHGFKGVGSQIEGIINAVACSDEGRRNHTLFWAARRLEDHIHAGRVTRADAEARLLDAACAAGLTDIEAQRTLSSASRRVA
ncbi:MAG: bifunctional DNA primase/polymerase [Pseudomonadota bacterium]|nr:bifunctional DNA primase/polymerase [Pseudomonadota bacterium]